MLPCTIALASFLGPQEETAAARVEAAAAKKAVQERQKEEKAELFYTPAVPELHQARKEIGEFSFKR